MHLTKQYLMQRINLLGIELNPNKKYKNVELIKELGNYMYNSSSNYSPNLSLILAYESLMLCSKYTDISLVEQEALFSSSKWIAEDKVPGVRCYLVYTPEEGFSFYGRGYNEYFLPVDYTSKVKIHLPNFIENVDLVDPAWFIRKFKTSFILDVEIYYTGKYDFNFYGTVNSIEQNMTNEILKLTCDQIIELLTTNNSKFNFYILDCLMFDNKDMTKYKLSYRKFVQETLVQNLLALFPTLPFHNIRKYFTTKDKEDAWEMQLNTQGEGLVFKNTEQPYNTTETRKKNGWVKLKTNMEFNSNQVDLTDVDCFITGFVSINGTLMPYVHSLTMSINLRRKDGSTYLHELGELVIPTLAQRKHFTDLSSGVPKLADSYYNKVCSVSIVKLKASNTNLLSSKLELRVDKTAFECVLPEGDIL